MPSICLRFDPNTASFKDFGDEVVIIHNESGVFYSLKGRAMAVWNALAEGLDPAAVDARLRETDPAEADIVESMLAEFKSKGMVVSAADAAGADQDLPWTNLGPAQFESYSDFDDLIRLDPIHDVADSGWPYRKGDPE